MLNDKDVNVVANVNAMNQEINEIIIYNCVPELFSTLDGARTWSGCCFTIRSRLSKLEWKSAPIKHLANYTDSYDSFNNHLLAAGGLSLSLSLSVYIYKYSNSDAITPCLDTLDADVSGSCLESSQKLWAKDEKERSWDIK